MHELSRLDLINSDDIPKSYALMIILNNGISLNQNIRYIYVLFWNHEPYWGNTKKITYVLRKDFRQENTAFHVQYLH